ncbi:MAG: CRISPR-associated helicase Cas3' [Micrococcales bacterium]|nr:CRISPR-associated helicase Cas3' [Micrococcales bacterium]
MARDGEANDPDLGLWGKREGATRPLPVLCHMLSTAACAGVLWDVWLRPGLRDLLVGTIAPGNRSLTRRIVMAIAGLHDVGKINPVFQTQAFNPRATWGSQVATDLKSAGYPVPQMLDSDQVRRHEYVSLSWLHDGTVPTMCEKAVDAFAATVVGGHHGRWHAHEGSRSRYKQVAKMCAGPWADQQGIHAEAVLEALGLDAVPQSMTGDDAPAAVIVLTGLVILADWLASHEDAVRQDISLLDTMGGTVTSTAAWVARRDDWFRGRNHDVEEREAHDHGFVENTVGIYEKIADPTRAILGKHYATPSPLQRDVQRPECGAGRGLMLVTYPTGDGKTEAALLRNEATGSPLTFALPTRATATSVMRRVERAYETTGNKGALAHGTARIDTFYADWTETDESQVLIDDADRGGLTPTAWLGSAKKKILAPIAVSTVDQVLAGALRQKWTALRLLAVANRHVVLDEVHTFDHYQSVLLADLLAWWGATRTRVTLLSATMPTWQRNLFTSAYNPAVPAIEKADAQFPAVTTVVPPGDIPLPDGSVTHVQTGSPRLSYTLGIDHHASADATAHHIEWASRMHETYPEARIAVVVNTVGRAQEIGIALSTAGFPVMVLHSRMTAKHREDRAKELEAKAATGAGSTGGMIVIGTQVIEASLDVDFDLMCSDLAPAASLIQRAGRLWRGDDDQRATRLPDCGERVLVVHSTIDSETDDLAHRSQTPYLLAEIRKTYSVVCETEAIRVPEDVQGFVDNASLSVNEVVANLDMQDEPDAETKEFLHWVDKRLRASTEVSIGLRPTDGWKGYLADPRYRYLVHMTERSEDNDTATRFTDYASRTFLIIDQTGATHGAYTQSVRSLVQTYDPGELRDAVGATVPASGVVMRLLDAAHARTIAECCGGTWEPRSSMLTGYLPVDVSWLDGLKYDEGSGLIRCPAKEDV